VADDQHGESDGSAPAFDVTRPAGAWTRQQRAALAGQLRPAMRTAEIARRLGVAPSTVRDYLSDPDGQQARARRQTRAREVCSRCGRRTGARRGRRAFLLCPRCAAATRAKWSREDVIDAYLAWSARFGVEPTSTDWNHTHAQRRGGVPLERFGSGRWPTLTVIARLFGRWSELAAAARERSRGQPPAPFSRPEITGDPEGDPNPSCTRVRGESAAHSGWRARPKDVA
jgi:hypothetical protein